MYYAPPDYSGAEIGAHGIPGTRSNKLKSTRHGRRYLLYTYIRVPLYILLSLDRSRRRRALGCFGASYIRIRMADGGYTDRTEAIAKQA